MTAIRRRVWLLAGLTLALFAVGAGWFHARDQHARLQRGAAMLQRIDAAEWRLNETVLRLAQGGVGGWRGVQRDRS